MQISRRTLLGVGGVVVVAGGAAVWQFSRPTASGGDSAASARGGAIAATASGDPRLAERSIGRADAPVVVREFFSLTCSHCATFHRETMPRVKRDLVDTGKVRMVFHDFPLDQIALAGAAVARALPPASYEPFITALLASQDRWAFARGVNNIEEIAKIAALAGLSRSAFDAAVADEALRAEILKGRDEYARTYGIESTPSFVFNGPGATNRREAGARPYDEFARLVQQAAG